MNWATRAGDGKAGLLLERNPLAGLPVPREENPRRPMLSDEDYRAMCRVASAVHPAMPVLLVVAHDTGHRVGALRRLRWSDIDFATGRIRFRAESNRIGFEHRPPASTETLTALGQWRRQRGDVIGDGWVFPSPTDTTRPVSSAMVKRWWKRSERLAEIQHVPGRGWHSFRRKLATEMEIPLKDLCYLGGW